MLHTSTNLLGRVRSNRKNTPEEGRGELYAEHAVSIVINLHDGMGRVDRDM
jgi:hypothetical protein